MARNALGLEFGSAIRLSKRPGSVWNCLWGHALKRSPGINRERRVSYPGPRFLSSATWPSLLKKHYNGLINQSINLECHAQDMTPYSVTLYRYRVDLLLCYLSLWLVGCVWYPIDSKVIEKRQPHLQSLAKGVKLGIYTIPTGNWTRAIAWQSITQPLRQVECQSSHNYLFSCLNV